MNEGAGYMSVVDRMVNAQWVLLVDDRCLREVNDDNDEM
jgi:hypothetical protein